MLAAERRPTPGILLLHAWRRQRRNPKLLLFRNWGCAHSCPRKGPTVPLFFFSPLDLSEPELVSLFFYSQTDTTDKINLSLQNSSDCLLIIDQLDETKLPMFSDFVDERP
jgi:hypothetical protein